MRLRQRSDTRRYSSAPPKHRSERALRGVFRLPPLADVQRILGHSNAATTSIYLHVFDSDLAAKVQALNGTH